MSLLTTDGTVTIYKIQHMRDDGSWVNSNLDHFSFETPKRNSHAKHHFSDAGECRQLYGVAGGVLEEGIGLLGLTEIADANPKFTFRLVGIELTQTTHVVDTREPRQA